jgi:transcriptional regulator with XRE-family HTH domain
MPKAKPRTPRRGYPPPTTDDPPLLRVLIAEATRRGDTLATMARHLGVSYERVAQWRRKEADIANANRSVFEAAGVYLGVPTAYVLCMVGLITALDFTHPNRLSMRETLQRQLESLRLDPAFAGFFPDALNTADPTIQRFVVLLYRELGGGSIKPSRSFEWMRSMTLAALGNLQAQAELAALRTERS